MPSAWSSATAANFTWSSPTARASRLSCAAIIHAFQALAAWPRELWYDNLATAVAEHDGNLVRFHPRFLAFAREYNFFPRACQCAGGLGKRESRDGRMGYFRQNFWPLRTFTDLADVNFQVRHWLDEVANRAPPSRNRADSRRTFSSRDPCASCPPLLPDYRDTAEALVHKDLRLAFRRQSLLRTPTLCRLPSHR